MPERWRVRLLLVRWDGGPIDPAELPGVRRLLVDEGADPEVEAADPVSVRADVTVAAQDREAAAERARELLRNCAYDARVRMPPFDVEALEARPAATA